MQKNERPILHQRCGGRPGSLDDGCTYHIRVEKHIKEVLRGLGNNAAPRCREFVKNFCDCFVDNMNIIGCTAIAKQALGILY